MLSAIAQAPRGIASPIIVADSRGVRACRDLHARPRGATTSGTGSGDEERRTFHRYDRGKKQDAVSRATGGGLHNARSICCYLRRAPIGPRSLASQTLRRWLTREAEKYPAWRSPRTRGQGKNIDEFIRVLYRSTDDDSGSGLLIRCPRTTTKIVPGHRLLQLFAFLAARYKSRSHGSGRRQDWC